MLPQPEAVSFRFFSNLVRCRTHTPSRRPQSTSQIPPPIISRSRRKKALNKLSKSCHYCRSLTSDSISCQMTDCITVWHAKCVNRQSVLHSLTSTTRLTLVAVIHPPIKLTRLPSFIAPSALGYVAVVVARRLVRMEPPRRRPCPIPSHPPPSSLLPPLPSSSNSEARRSRTDRTSINSLHPRLHHHERANDGRGNYLPRRLNHDRNEDAVDRGNTPERTTWN